MHVGEGTAPSPFVNPGSFTAKLSGYLKSALVASLAARRQRLESGEDVVVGVNRFTETEPSPLTAAGAIAVERIDPAVEASAVESLRAWRSARSAEAVEAALAKLRADAATSANLMPSTMDCVRAGVTTGEWAGALREVFAEDVNLVGLSVLSGSHLAAVPAVLDGLRAAGLADVPVVVGGIIPAEDEAALREAGVARVFTPKDFGLTGIVDELVTVVREAAGLS